MIVEQLTSALHVVQGWPKAVQRQGPKNISTTQRPATLSKANFGVSPHGAENHGRRLAKSAEGLWS